jgi:hypothetical protein
MCVCCSGEAKAADVRESVQDVLRVCAPGVPGGGAERLLPLVHDPADDERALPEHPLHDLRVHAEVLQPQWPLQPQGAHGERRAGRRNRRRCHHPPRRLQNAAQHAGVGRRWHAQRCQIGKQSIFHSLFVFSRVFGQVFGPTALKTKHFGKILFRCLIEKSLKGIIRMLKMCLLSRREVQ